MKKSVQFLFLFLFISFGASTNAQKNWVISAPAGDRYTHIDKRGITILPNGRLIQPTGKTIMVAPHPYGLTLSNDGAIAVTANSGTNPLSISIIRNINTDKPEVQQVPPGPGTDKGILASVFMGLAIAPDNGVVYVGGGQENKIYLFNLKDGKSAGTISCSSKENGQDYSHGYIGDLVLSKDGNMLYAVDQINFRMVIVDTKTKKVTHSVPVGRYPFGIALSPDEKTVYVANVGMYEYKFLNSFDPKRKKESSVNYPSSAYLSKESIKGFKNDTIDVPGLGEPNVPESFSVFKIDVSDAAKPKVTAKIKTGFLVGQMVDDFPAVGGASPNSLVATNDFVYVSNGNNDCISVIDTKRDTVVNTIRLAIDGRLKKFRGIIPFGLAISPDYTRLFVAESGLNAVGIIDLPSNKMIGHIPVGWFPSKLKVTPDGKQIIVASAKGFGSGPNTGKDFVPGPEGSNIGNLMRGFVSVIDMPSANDLVATSKAVQNNNFVFTNALDTAFNSRKTNPIPLYPGEKESPIKHIVFIAKENRNFDDVFGATKDKYGVNNTARFGADVTVMNQNKTAKVDNCTVMPNHLALAKRFSIGDDFFCDSDHSADGHRWLADTYPNEWVETSVTAAYGDNRDWREDSKAPGNNSFVGSNASVYPEDYNEAGTIWDHFARHKIPFFNFGFGTEMAPGWEEPDFKHSGVKSFINYPISAPLYNNTSLLYATFNMGIPDQYRTDMFIKEFNDRWIGKGKTMPAVLTIALPNDHGAGERAKDGYPFEESYMADNDLALGRILEYLSHTEYWKSTMVVVTEDDPQGGVDHIDAHRSVLMVMSPYTKKNYVGHVHYSFGSIFKTFWNVLGIPYINHFDAGATDMSDLFTDKPDFTPYNAVEVDKRIFDPALALTPMDAKFNWKAVKQSPKMDDPEDMQRNSRELDLKKAAERKNKQR